MHMTLSSRFGLVLLLGALVAGCGDTGDGAGPAGNGGGTAPIARSDLDATFVVTGVTEGGQKHALVPGSEIRFTFTDGRLQITAGCNSMSGAYRLEGSRLTVESLATTEMGCDKPLMDQDTWVAGLFSQPVQFSAGNDAAIISGDVVLALADREVVWPDQPLAETVWVLDAVGDNDTVSSVGQVVAYVVFHGGRVNVYDGCNEGSASAEVEGSRITFGDRTTTLRGCTGAAVETVQAAFSDVVRGTATFTIEEGTLRILNGGRSLGFRAASKVPAHD